MIARLILALTSAFAVLLSTERAAALSCERIVSLAPSVTELLFDVGLGSHIVGATRFCRYPPEAARIEKIGGYFDVSVERLITLHPTLLVGLKEHEETLAAARRLGIETLAIDHTTVTGIRASYSQIGEACGRGDVAREKARKLTLREEHLQKASAGSPPLRTLVVVGRTHEGGATSGLYISGRDGFYSEVLSLVGLTNVNQSATIAIPSISEEGIRALNPEVIIEIVNRDDVVKEPVESFWKRYESLPAVRSGKVFVLSEDFASIPGPRYIELAELIARRLHNGDLEGGAQ